MENGSDQMLLGFMQETSPRPTAGASDSHASTSVSQEGKRALLAAIRDCSSELSNFLAIHHTRRDLTFLSLRTLRICLGLIEDGISPEFSLNWMGGGYGVEWQTLDSSCFGVPQSRERVFIVGHLGGGGRQVFPIPVTRRTNRIFQVGMDGTSHRKNPNQYRVYDPSGLAPTLSKMEGGGRQPIVETEKGLRFLTPRECFRLQGWTDEYFDRARPFNSDTQLYKQAGNGVTVPVIETIARRVIG